MSESPPPTFDIEEQVKKKFKRRQEIIVNWCWVIGVIATGWIVWFSTDPIARMHPSIPAILSMVFILSSIADTSKILMKEAQERELQRQYEWEKGKREENTRLVRLSDDGELEDLHHEDEVKPELVAQS